MLRRPNKLRSEIKKSCISMTPKQKAVSLGFKKDCQVMFEGKIYTIVRHGGGSIINPRVFIANNNGIFTYRSIKDLSLINDKSQKFKIGDKVKYKFNDYDGYLQYGEGDLVSSCNNKLIVEDRMIVMTENEECFCIPTKNLELLSREDGISYSRKIKTGKTFESKFIPGDIIKYENKISYVVSSFKCLLTGFNFLSLSNGTYCLDISVEMIDKCVYRY